MEGLRPLSEWKSEPRLLQWPFVKAYAGSEFVKFAAAIPVFGYLILFNDNVIGSIGFTEIAGVEASDDNPFWLSSVTKLRLAFFGGIFMLLANILQAWQSPRALAHSSNGFEFAERVLSTYSFGEIVAMQREVQSDDWILRTPMTENLNRMSSESGFTQPDFSGYHDKQIIIRKSKDYLQAVSREWWTGQMHQRRAWRYLILVVASAGYMMLLTPTLDITKAVFLDLVR